jgi:3-isopropylmalate/(R)-2-methylmalate dehydratase small subunit
VCRNQTAATRANDADVHVFVPPQSWSRNRHTKRKIADAKPSALLGASLPHLTLSRFLCYRTGVAKYEDLIAGDDGLLAMTGCAWVFGDHVVRSQLLDDPYLSLNAEEASAFAMATLHPDFSRHVAAGDFIVAGLEFGSDASLRVIPAALKALGIGAVIARSFGHFFVRNAINVALPPLMVEETAAIKAGDRLRVDIEGHIVANLSSGDRYVIRNLDDEAMAILRAGGIVEYARRAKNVRA